MRINYVKTVSYRNFQLPFSLYVKTIVYLHSTSLAIAVALKNITLELSALYISQLRYWFHIITIFMTRIFKLITIELITIELR